MDLERAVSYSLRLGVVAGASLSLVGLVLWALQGFGNIDPASGRDVSETLLSAFQGRVEGVVYLGVAVLVATPIFRVLLSVVFFGIEKDRRYVGITLLVLGMIILGIAYQSVA